MMISAMITIHNIDYGDGIDDTRVKEVIPIVMIMAIMLQNKMIMIMMLLRIIIIIMGMSVMMTAIIMMMLFQIMGRKYNL